MNPVSSINNAESASGGRPCQKAAKVLAETWMEGFRVFGRFLWFMISATLASVPVRLVYFLLNPREKGVFENGKFEVLAGVSMVVMLLGLPIAFGWAARMSGELLPAMGRKRGRVPGGESADNRLKQFIRMWSDGLWVLGRFYGFVLVLMLVVVPCGWMLSHLNPGDDVVGRGGPWKVLAWIPALLMVLSFPLACAIASWGSRQFKGSAGGKRR